MTHKISVIVPIYKVEKELRRCVESIINQTYQNLEIILVDDGSPDRCGEICDQLAKEDGRIKVVHKTNGGLSSARNAGLEIATGDYIGFIDSDDYILPSMYEKLYDALIRDHSDIGICNYAYVNELTNEIDPSETSPIKTEVLNQNEAYQKLNPMRPGYSFYVIACNKLYKRSLFDQVRFKDGHIHEDEYIVHHLFALAERISTIDDVLYMYIQRAGSITNSKNAGKSLDAVYSLYDRYSFFLQMKERALAVDLLRSAYWVMTEILCQENQKDGAKKVNEAAYLVFKSMVRRADLRVCRLVLCWLKFVFRK